MNERRPATVPDRLRIGASFGWRLLVVAAVAALIAVTAAVALLIGFFILLLRAFVGEAADLASQAAAGGYEEGTLEPAAAPWPGRRCPAPWPSSWPWCAKGAPTALAVLAIVLVVQQQEANVLGPLLTARAVRFHPVATFLMTSAAAVFFGVIGMFLVVPAAGAFVAMSRELRPRLDGGDVDGRGRATIDAALSSRLGEDSAFDGQHHPWGESAIERDPYVAFGPRRGR